MKFEVRQNLFVVNQTLLLLPLLLLLRTAGGLSTATTTGVAAVVKLIQVRPVKTVRITGMYEYTE